MTLLLIIVVFHSTGPEHSEPSILPKEPPAIYYGGRPMSREEYFWICVEQGRGGSDVVEALPLPEPVASPVNLRKLMGRNINVYDRD